MTTLMIIEAQRSALRAAETARQIRSGKREFKGVPIEEAIAKVTEAVENRVAELAGR